MMPIENRKETVTSSSLRALIESYGGVCWKIDSDVGVPDRFCAVEGWAFMAEIKQQGGKPDPAQEKKIDQLNSLGFSTFVIYGKDGLDTFEREYLAGRWAKRVKTEVRVLDYPD